ncbi:hypothetical protein KFL_000090410 [Klebsormidium nitens]|uniref:DUF7875 domain-containing protein n=1 Tax=Klebsormidium nitens TaxID=105231 RepID=A0A1Y1HI92_KLENI|nr:hypothetical protein KFL_000090410 [Klebsormidium nitens]|eukprot:GAQ78195.1 hypothetical protein KFL_000090410 [Klebsormidium nitens]
MSRVHFGWFIAEARLLGWQFECQVGKRGHGKMALRQPLGASDGYLMRSDATPCSLLTNQLAKIGFCGGAFLGLPFCYINYGPRFTWPRAFRWMAGGAVLGAGFLVVHTILWEPACELQNIQAYDSPEGVIRSSGSQSDD